MNTVEGDSKPSRQSSSFRDSVLHFTFDLLAFFFQPDLATGNGCAVPLGPAGTSWVLVSRIPLMRLALSEHSSSLGTIHIVPFITRAITRYISLYCISNDSISQVIIEATSCSNNKLELFEISPAVHGWSHVARIAISLHFVVRHSQYPRYYFSSS